uniref:Uncharacterized protein n=1 Tax=Oryza sativa subsp. japonica TaxID=39947 RepID=Q69UE1_ORYSJ|nr:hypothetical protein [Oryza sativa Japonica Group]
MWPARSRFGMGRPRPRTVWPMTSKTRARRRGGMGAGGHGEAKDEGGTISEVEADDDWFAPLQQIRLTMTKQQEASTNGCGGEEFGDLMPVILLLALSATDGHHIADKLHDVTGEAAGMDARAFPLVDLYAADVGAHIAMVMSSVMLGSSNMARKESVRGQSDEAGGDEVGGGVVDVEHSEKEDQDEEHHKDDEHVGVVSIS